MKTQIITIGAKQDDGTYPVALYFDDGTATWRSTPRATAAIVVEHRNQAECPTPAVDGDFCPKCMIKFLLETAGASPRFLAIGQHLWAIFETGDRQIATAFATNWDAHAKVTPEDDKEGLRTILDIRARELRALPWEMMIRGGVSLFSQPLNPVLRGRLNEAAAPGPANGWLLKVLLVVGTDDPDIAADQEIGFVQDALRRLGRMVDCRVERPGSLKDLIQSHNSFRPDVLHFIGHSRDVGGESLLEFKNGGQPTWDWKKSAIKESFAVKGPPRLAFLNACRTQQPETREAISSLAEEFIAAGTLAVVAMQADIKGSAAATFSSSVYCALAAGHPIDVALAQARFNLRLNEDDKNRRDWSLPSLSVSVPVDAVLSRRSKDLDERRQQIEKTPEFAAIRTFVDRAEERRQLDPLAAQDVQRDLLIVTGPELAGKTALLHWVLEGCAWCEHQVKYVDLRRPEGRPAFLKVLRLMQQAELNPTSRLRQRLDGDFTKFDALAPLVDTSGETAPGLTTARPDDPIDALFSAFRAALVASAHERPLVIALDHLGSMVEAGFLKFLKPYLLDYVVQGRLEPVRVILGCNDADYRAFELDAFGNLAQRVRIDNFQAAEFPTLVTEFLLHRNVPRERIPPTKPRPNAFSPKMLTDYYNVLLEAGQL